MAQEAALAVRDNEPVGDEPVRGAVCVGFYQHVRDPKVDADLCKLVAPRRAMSLRSQAVRHCDRIAYFGPRHLNIPR